MFQVRQACETTQHITYNVPVFFLFALWGLILPVCLCLLANLVGIFDLFILEGEIYLLLVYCLSMQHLQCLLVITERGDGVRQPVFLVMNFHFRLHSGKLMFAGESTKIRT